MVHIENSTSEMSNTEARELSRQVANLLLDQISEMDVPIGTIKDPVSLHFGYNSGGREHNVKGLGSDLLIVFSEGLNPELLQSTLQQVVDGKNPNVQHNMQQMLTELRADGGKIAQLTISQENNVSEKRGAVRATPIPDSLVLHGWADVNSRERVHKRVRFA